jgi:hypothetical protein
MASEDVFSRTLERVKTYAKEPRVFVSYSHADQAFVDKLLRSLKVLPVSVWVDKLEIRVGDSIIDKVASGLRDADALVIVLSPASVTSRWVAEELNAAFMRMMEGREVRVCPALMERCELPLFLAGRKYADFTGNYARGLRDLIEGIIPDLTLWTALKRIAAEFESLLGVIERSTDRAEIYQALASLDILLSLAVSKRYQIAIKRHIDNVNLQRYASLYPPHDFYAMFGFLEFRGLALKSPAWAALRDFRNQFVHACPGPEANSNILLDDDPEIVRTRVALASNSADEALRNIAGLRAVMKTLSAQDSE